MYRRTPPHLHIHNKSSRTSTVAQRRSGRTHDVEQDHEGWRELGGDSNSDQAADGEGSPEAGGEVGAIGSRHAGHHLRGVAVDVASIGTLGKTKTQKQSRKLV